jgi:hypothetical protein
MSKSIKVLKDEQRAKRESQERKPKMKASPVGIEWESAMVGHVDLMRDLKRLKD